MIRPNRVAALGALSAALAFPAIAQTVKVTPLGGFDGEFCAQDRALVFEDPNGTRILYDPGRSVAGAEDPRLGKIDIILVSHMHGDHLGNAYLKALNGGTCAAPDASVSAMPNSTAVSRSEWHRFIGLSSLLWKLVRAAQLSNTGRAALRGLQ